MMTVLKNILLITLLSAAVVFAGQTGKIAGQLLDASTKEPIVGANIYLKDLPLGASTDEEGYFAIINIPPGTYTVIAQMINYQQKSIENVKVSIDLTTRLDIKLNPQTLELDEAIVVTAERPLVQKDITSTAVTVSYNEMKTMPVEEFEDVVSLQAGVVEGHFRGGRTGEVAYLIDGIPVNDPFDNSMSVQMENASIQQLEVISGTFNAEYGQAMSGVVNIVTKDGGSDFSANATAYVGNYVSNHDDIFPHLGRVDGSAIQNAQVFVSGPIGFIKGLSFFFNGRYYNDEGYIFGQDIFRPADDIVYDNESGSITGFYSHGRYIPYSEHTVDSVKNNADYVPMQDYRKYSFFGKLSYYVFPKLKISFSASWDDFQAHYYDHDFFLTPAGIANHYGGNQFYNIIFNHTISNNIFQTFKFSYKRAEYEGYLYEDPYDPRYQIREHGLPLSGYTFRTGGNQPWRYRRSTDTQVAKWDLTGQFSREHKVGIGLEFRQHKVYNFATEFFTLDALDSTGQIIQVNVYPEKGGLGYEEYTKKPVEFTAYIQDKMEYEDFIINLGLRFDYFDPKAQLPANKKNPENNPLFPGGWVDAKVKYQLSPRIGCAFPISEQGVLHFSYGHFFQIPNFEILYHNSNFRFAKGGQVETITGNPDLQPQSTVMYELGLQQVLYTNVVMDLTMYYRDMRNLVDTEIIATEDANKYARYVNRDYGNVRGIILSVEKRFSGHWSATLDYTYQIAEGNASDPNSVYQNNQTDPPVETEKKVIPLDWDQRHTLNMTLNTGVQNNWNIGLIGRYGSGIPYTADLMRSLDITFRNNRRQPPTFTVDLRAEKMFQLGKTELKIYLLVYNLFDRLNEEGVYATTGRANRDLNVQYAGDIIGLNTYQEYINNPAMYSEPRQIRLGLMLSF